MKTCLLYPRLGFCSFLLWVGFSSAAFAHVKVSYGVPVGFSVAEMDEGASYVATFDGQTLPGLISYSVDNQRLAFDAKLYAANGIPAKEINEMEGLLAGINYRQCENGCNLQVHDYHVSIDKVRRKLDIRSAFRDYITPETTWGLINNQSLDVRKSSSGYRTMSIEGDTWLGMPGRTFGHMNWYLNNTSMPAGVRGGHRQSTTMEEISSYYLQKNFAGSYLRAGRQDSVDYSSGSVSTVLSPSFEQFVTYGSQDNLRSSRDAGSMTLYAIGEGNYEFYRNGRQILKRPAVLGRNDISFADLPGGYYPVEIRLVDRNGNVISQERRDVNNLNFAGGGGNAWHVTAGREMGFWGRDGGRLIQVSGSHNFSQAYINASAVSGSGARWASEVNITRPTILADIDLSPTVGLLSGERSNGGYFNLAASHDELGSLMLSRYQNTNVSDFYWGTPSTSASYSRSFAGTMLTYNYQKYSHSESQQAEVRWNYRPNGLWSTFSVGVQKGGFAQNNNDYGLYFNMTWSLDRSQASFSVAQSGGQTQLSGTYQNDFVDSYGTTTAGITASQIDQAQSINVFGSRAGSRGDVSLNVGQGDGENNLDLNYRGMLAVNAEGAALGRYSYGGSAMLLETPALDGTPYGFTVEGSPVGSGSKYAVPLNSYGDVGFAQVQSNNTDMDMNIEVPANIIRAHPGQVYNTHAKVDLHMVYSGLLIDMAGKPVAGKIRETGDTAYRNGLFSISSKAMLHSITVEQAGSIRTCDLANPVKDSYYLCK